MIDSDAVHLYWTLILTATLTGLSIGFGSVLGLEPEAAEAVLFVITMTASFYGFSSWLEGMGRPDIRKADLRDYRLGRWA